MFRDMLLSAIVAGLMAACAMTVVQALWVSPLILQAEVYEDAAEAAGHHEHEVASAGEHHHDASDWKPQDGWSRTLFTIAANVPMGVGYAFLLTAVYILWRHPASAGYGLLYGLAGFAVFFVAPALGLPPELPGTAAAALTPRQHWWVGTALATAAGLALIFCQSRWWLRAVGIAVLVVPHVIAAPHPAIEGGLAPAELQSRFRVATTICNAIFWLVLGWGSAFTYRKIFLGKIRPQT